MHSVVGKDDAAKKLRALLKADNVDCKALISDASLQTSCKTRIIAQRQQVVRVDRESKTNLEPRLAKRLLKSIDNSLAKAKAIIGDCHAELSRPIESAWQTAWRLAEPRSQASAFARLTRTVSHYTKPKRGVRIAHSTPRTMVKDRNLMCAAATHWRIGVESVADHFGRARHAYLPTGSQVISHSQSPVKFLTYPVRATQ